MMRFRGLTAVWIALCALAIGCAGSSVPPQQLSTLPPIRFLLTFDDGPSISLSNNPTRKIADTLAQNPVQPDIKAVFFIQTRWPGAGGAALGKQLIKRLADDGHVLGIHSGTVRGHIDHRKMHETGELLESLRDGHADIEQYGKPSGLIRPPFWAFNPQTLSTYDRAGVSMLLTDLRARDGVFHWYQVDPQTGGRLHRDFAHFQQRLLSGAIQAVDGVVPVVVTFHDTNTFTAEQLATYLSTLIDVGRAAGMRVADPPFYADHASLLRAARGRAKNQASKEEIAP
jgi:peptidoglycan/xylan/chitin deacetylase (PgdA/CDA1 family)